MLIQILGTFAALPLAATAPPPAGPALATTPTRIEAVTVFRTQALVVRRADVRIAEPRRGQKLVLAGFPAGLDQSSIQARCSGPARPTIVDFVIRDLAEPAASDPEREAKTAAEIAVLQKAIRDLGDQDRALSDAIAHLEERGQGLRALRQVYLSRIQKGEGEVELSQWMEEQAKVEGALEALAAERRKSERGRRDLAELVASAQKRTAELGTRPAPQSIRVGELELTARRAGRITCRMRYLIAGVAWQMHYDARLEDHELQLTQYGMVTNQTGESWEEVGLALSTADPVRSVQLPQAVPHVVRALMPRPVGGWHRSRPASVAMAARVSEDAERAARPNEAEVPPPDATLTQRQLYAVYTAASRATVLSGSTARRVALATHALRPELRYLAMPRSAPGAYLTARARHAGEFPLLPGEVRLFLGDDLVGHTQIALTDPGSEIALPFGRDERVRVERERLTRDFRQIVSAADVAQKRPAVKETEVTDQYLVRVRNDSGRPVALELVDQLPIAGDGVVKVALDEGSTPRSFMSDQDVPGTLRWMMEVGKNGTASVRFGYRVRYPLGRQVVGL